MHKPIPIEIAPGIYTEHTARGSLRRWRDGDHVRFFNGLPQKIGGWKLATADQVVGKARGVIDWQTLSVEKLRGIGTHLKLYVESGGDFFDITPLRDSGTLGTDPFTTTDTEVTVSVAHTSHGLSEGDYVHYSGAAAVGGITIDGEYTVTSVTDSDNYVITHSAAATSSATGGGATVDYEYEIPIGSGDTFGLYGFGTGTFGTGTFGTARTATTLLNLARIWSFAQWGEDLIANPRGGGIYAWDASVGTGTRAAVISGAPSTAKAIILSPENRHLIALGAHDGSNDDPMLIRWASAEDYTDWTPSATNTAGDKRLDDGTEIYCGVPTDREIGVFTNSAFYSMVFEGPPYQFNIQRRGSCGGIMGPNAAKEHDGRIWWMGEADFMVYDGRVRKLPCDVWSHVFKDFNTAQKAKVFAGANRGFGELWWLYPSADSSECDLYVLYNVNDNTWAFGTLDRTVLVGDSDIFDEVYALSPDGELFNHEQGVDDDGAALPSYIESYDFDANNGSVLMLLEKFLPDFARLIGSISVTLKGRKYPHSSQVTKGPQAMTSATEYVGARMRARQISLRLETTDAGDDWRIGTLRVTCRPLGKR